MSSHWPSHFCLLQSVSCYRWFLRSCVLAFTIPLSVRCGFLWSFWCNNCVTHGDLQNVNRFIIMWRVERQLKNRTSCLMSEEWMFMMRVRLSTATSRLKAKTQEDVHFTIIYRLHSLLNGWISIRMSAVYQLWNAYLASFHIFSSPRWRRWAINTNRHSLQFHCS